MFPLFNSYWWIQVVKQMYVPPWSPCIWPLPEVLAKDQARTLLQKAKLCTPCKKPSPPPPLTKVRSWSLRRRPGPVSQPTSNAQPWIVASPELPAQKSLQKVKPFLEETRPWSLYQRPGPVSQPMTYSQPWIASPEVLAKSQAFPCKSRPCVLTHSSQPFVPAYKWGIAPAHWGCGPGSCPEVLALKS